jgi:pyrroloquinoline quinone biosynthesis protein B
MKPTSIAYCNPVTLLLLLLAWFALPIHSASAQEQDPKDNCEVIVLGIAQDAGFPQAGCKRDCCKAAWGDPELRRFASSIAIVDHQTGQRWLLDCSPDFREQLRLLDELAPVQTEGIGISGIFLTHAHIGHYAGLIHLGREAIGANSIDVHAMPRMSKFLSSNGPWDQLVKLKNISVQPLAENTTVKLNERISVTPIQVPHRDEYSETVGFIVNGPNRKLLYLPDIDKWSRWDQSINDWVGRVDISLLDGTFFANGEIAGRDMSQIPHPFVEESIKQFAEMPEEKRNGINFIHLNHTNPAINANSRQRDLLRRAGMDVVEQGQAFDF